jgi:hypothetical protein
VLADFADSMESSSNEVVTSLKAWARVTGSPRSGLSRKATDSAHSAQPITTPISINYLSQSISNL